MNTKLKGCLLSLILLVTVTAVHAQTRLAEANTSADMDSAIILDSVPVKRNFFRKFLNYFNDANKEKKNKKFDFSIIGGPHYSSDTKLGLGLVAAGLYRSDRNDVCMGHLQYDGLLSGLSGRTVLHAFHTGVRQSDHSS